MTNEHSHTTTQNPLIRVGIIFDEFGEYDWRTDKQYLPIEGRYMTDFIDGTRTMHDLEKLAFDSTKAYDEKTRGLIGRGLGSLAASGDIVTVTAIGPTDGWYALELPLITS